MKLDFNNELEKCTLSEAYTEALDLQLAEDKDVVSVDADLMHAIGVQNIIEKYPNRIMDVGVAEANMVGIATGLSYADKKPYIHTFACFVSRRAFDQIFISSGYGHNPIRIFGSDPGICAAYNGGTHMPFEDIGIMRTIPDAIIVDISDSTMMREIVKQARDAKGVFYFRASRSAVKKIYANDADFKIGKGNVLVDGSDVTIITSGMLVSESLNAAKKLKEMGISVAVIDMFTIKPIDKKLIEEYARKTGAIVVTDNHNANGGLGDAVAAVLCDQFPVPMKKLAVFDEYGQVGPYEFLQGYYHLDENGIIEKVKEVLKMKEK